MIIAAQRLGLTTIAVDRYENAPAMQVADHSRVIDMLDGDAIEKIVNEFKPDFIVPEIEAIRTSKLLELEKKGFNVIPCAYATDLTMNRDKIRDLAAKDKMRTARFAYAHSSDELQQQIKIVGLPCVVKPVMSSSGKGQSVVKKTTDILKSWEYACSNMRGDQKKVIVEEFIDFELEITLLTIRTKQGKTLFAPAIGHRQERGDYQESWQPAALSPLKLKQAQKMAKKITDRLGGYGLFGVEFFLTKKEVIFSELSPRPHDTGMVTLISQNLSEFELHLRAILGLPIPEIKLYGPSASAVVLADRESEKFHFAGVEKALEKKGTEVRIFGKPSTRPYRRMAVTLARAKTIKEARALAQASAKKIKIIYS